MTWIPRRTWPGWRATARLPSRGRAAAAASPRSTSMPQVCVTLSPGSSISRSTPDTKALGGQVIGSMATAWRRCAGSSVSPVNTCSHS